MFRAILWIVLNSTLLGLSSSFAGEANMGQMGTLEFTPESSVTPVGHISRANQDLPLKDQTPILLNDRISTSSGDTATLHFLDGSQITLAQSTTIRVTHFSSEKTETQIRVELEGGLIHTVVTKAIPPQNKSFLIKTPSVTMGVRGTSFVVNVPSPENVSLYTLHGKVAIAKSEADLSSRKLTRVVTAGKMSTFGPRMDQPSAPKIFNRKTFLTFLNQKSPGLSKEIKKQETVRRTSQIQSKKGEHSKKEWRPVPHRRPVGHH